MMEMTNNIILFFFKTVMFLCGWLLIVTLIPVISSVNPGVEVKITDKGIEYGEQSCSRIFSCLRVSSRVSKLSLFLGRQLGIATIQQKLKSIRLPDFSGKERVSPIGKVSYSLTK